MIKKQSTNDHQLDDVVDELPIQPRRGNISSTTTATNDDDGDDDKDDDGTHNVGSKPGPNDGLLADAVTNMPVTTSPRS